jgi:hypothetical protein
MYGNHHETTIFPANTIDLLCFFNIIKTKIKIDKGVLKTFEICMPCIFTYQRIHISAPQFSLNINAATLRNFDVPK